MSEAATTPSTRRALKGPRKATAAYLERAALHHLQRHSTTCAGLRKVLMRRVDRSAKAYGTDAKAGTALVEELIARFERAGILDDGRFASGRAASLLRRGASPRAIAFKLRAKGVAPAEIAKAIDGLHETAENPELEAAQNLARRRKLGPFRPPGREEDRQREIAILMRAGFSYGIAKRVLISGPE